MPPLGDTLVSIMSSSLKGCVEVDHDLLVWLDTNERAHGLRFETLNQDSKSIASVGIYSACATRRGLQASEVWVFLT